MPKHVADCCPRLCSRLWGELDIIPLILPDSSLVNMYATRAEVKSLAWNVKSIDEQAEAMSRKCVR